MTHIHTDGQSWISRSLKTTYLYFPELLLVCNIEELGQFVVYNLHQLVLLPHHQQHLKPGPLVRIILFKTREMKVIVFQN